MYVGIYILFSLPFDSPLIFFNTVAKSLCSTRFYSPCQSFHYFTFTSTGSWVSAQVYTHLRKYRGEQSRRSHASNLTSFFSVFKLADFFFQFWIFIFFYLYLHTIFLLLFQKRCLHFPATNLPQPIVMVKAEYGKLNVCKITWLGLSPIKKVTQCNRLDCHGVCRLYCSLPEEAFACWMKTRSRIRQCLLISQKWGPNPKSKKEKGHLRKVREGFLSSAF